MCAGPDALDCEDTGFSTQPSGDQSGKLGHTCPHMALIGLKQNIALIMDEREEMEGCTASLLKTWPSNDYFDISSMIKDFYYLDDGMMLQLSFTRAHAWKLPI